MQKCMQKQCVAQITEGLKANAREKMRRRCAE